MATIEDLDHRVTALERAQTTTGGALDRIDRKVDRAAERVTVLDTKVEAMHRIIAESEARTAKRIEESEVRLGAKMTESEQRLENRMAGIEHRIDAARRETASQLNDFEQRILAALDKLQNPPK